MQFEALETVNGEGSIQLEDMKSTDVEAARNRSIESAGTVELYITFNIQ